MSGARHFEFVTEDPGRRRWRGFARSVARRFTAKTVAATWLALWILDKLRSIGATFNAPVEPAPPPLHFTWSVLTIIGCQAASTVLAVLIADEAVERGARRGRAYLIAVLGGTLFASIAQYLVRSLLDWRVYTTDDQFLVRIAQPANVFLDQMPLAALATFVYVNLRTARKAATHRHAAELARLEARRRTLESKLQAMQARVEPQFLFNTLAQVRQLYQADAAKAGKMLDDLIAYLRAALPHLRESSSTLGKEIALASAYLEIVRIRLGQRLSFDVTVPARFAHARMPPMMLLPLIDHALVCGIGKQPGPGMLRIECLGGDGRLRLTITDSGAGFMPGANDGDLQDIGDRLDALYGCEAQFRREALDDEGTRAILEIPYDTADRGDR